MINKNIYPKCQLKWQEFYGHEINWKIVWGNLKKVNVTNKMKEFQWKCIHNIIYTESKLKKMQLSNGKCHICQTANNTESLQHLFFDCNTTKLIISKIKDIFTLWNIQLDDDNLKQFMLLGDSSGHSNQNLLVNLFFILTKWSVWKIRNKIKYDGIKMSSTYILNLWKSYMVTHLKSVPCYLSINTLDKEKINTLINFIL